MFKKERKRNAATDGVASWRDAAMLDSSTAARAFANAAFHLAHVRTVSGKGCNPGVFIWIADSRGGARATDARLPLSAVR